MLLCGQGLLLFRALPPPSGARMPLFFVIDDDGSTRATREALRQHANLTAQGAGAAACDAVVADPCLQSAHGSSKLQALAACDPAAQLITISREGAIASIHDAPDFPSMAGRLATK
jgi:hypothetical protein